MKHKKIYFIIWLLSTSALVYVGNSLSIKNYTHSVLIGFGFVALTTLLIIEYINLYYGEDEV